MLLIGNDIFIVTFTVTVVLNLEARSRYLLLTCEKCLYTVRTRQQPCFAETLIVKWYLYASRIQLYIQVFKKKNISITWSYILID